MYRAAECFQLAAILNRILEGIYMPRGTEKKLLDFLAVSSYEHLNIFETHSLIAVCFEIL